MSFKLHAVLSSIMKSPTLQAWNLNHPLILFVHAVYAAHPACYSGACSLIRSTVAVLVCLCSSHPYFI